MKTLISLVNQLPSHPTPSVDFIRDKNGTLLAVSRLLNHYEAIKAPSSWCGSNNDTSGEFSIKSKKRKISELSPQHWDRLLTKCFPDYRLNRRNDETVRQSLRTIRDAFQSAGIPLYLTFGSVLGSTRYQRRMPYDVDYDMWYMKSDAKRVGRLLHNLSTDPQNEMRAFNITLSWANIKIGLGCGKSSWWRHPFYWIFFGNQITLSDNAIPQMHTFHPATFALHFCSSYIDLYGLWKEAPAKNSYKIKGCKPELPESSLQELTYTSIEGTIFQTIRASRPFLEKIYDSSLDVCVPKEDIHPKKWQLFHSEAFSCSDIEVPCSLLDRRFPRVHGFTNKDRGLPGRYEVGLQLDRFGQCMIRSLFYSKSPP